MIELAQRTAKQFKLPYGLVCAICEVESDWNPVAMRFEPMFFTRYISGKDIAKPIQPCNRVTEEIALATSWGLMQIMGATARQVGFDKAYLSELTIPEVGLTYGCRYLLNVKSKYDSYGLGGIISAYNAGKPIMDKNGLWVNQSYVSKVLAAINKYK